MVHETAPFKHFNVDELVEAFKLETSSSFKENVITVEGIVTDINFLNNRNTIILKGKENSGTFVLCDIQKDAAVILKTIKFGDTITIKGILKGSLQDIILLNCIISNDTNQ
jgi:hypothetical protein